MKTLRLSLTAMLLTAVTMFAQSTPPPPGVAGSGGNNASAGSGFETCVGLSNLSTMVDCSGCYIKYADGSIGSKSGAWVSGGCDTNSPTYGQVICFETGTSGVTVAGGYMGYYTTGATNAQISRNCYVWDGVRWVPENNKKLQGGLVTYGNIINMQGYGTNIIAAGETQFPAFFPMLRERTTLATTAMRTSLFSKARPHRET